MINRPKFIFRFCESNIFPSSVSYYPVFHIGKIYQLKIKGLPSRVMSPYIVTKFIMTMVLSVLAVTGYWLLAPGFLFRLDCLRLELRPKVARRRLAAGPSLFFVAEIPLNGLNEII
jgi:hypothetical protein